MERALQSGQVMTELPPPGGASPRTAELVAASLLRIGGDALAARLFKTLPTGAGAAELVGLLASEPGARARTLDDARERAERALVRAREIGAQAIGLGEPGYPEWLAQIIDPPIVVWVLGNPAVLARASIAVVGSRRPSPGGLFLAERLARGLAETGLAVTSGLAKGIDGAAHRGAIGAAGATIAVLGSGLDVIYPSSHEALAREAVRNGCLVSELPPGTPPFPSHFPLRNRVISGLSRAVVVVEAAERSGSLITARMALEQGRSVCAVPGPVAPGAHQGCHALIKDGARLVESVVDIFEEIGWRAPASGPGPDRGKSMSDSWLCQFMKPGDPVAVDRLAELTGRGGADLLAELGRLELEGTVERVAGGWFVRLD